MSATLEQALRGAAEPLHAPGQVTWQVISPARLAAAAAEHEMPRWQVEIAALEAEVVPLLYLRNVGRYGIEGQLTLLRSTVTAISRPRITTTIHDCARSICTNETSAAVISSLSARGSMN